ncbi:Gfo/Idh/MocA family oxidoreductase [Limisphaera ngatamarikiensis]|uniref:Gfo/Idh/MocA family oxidoreductase n=1 Tax=Limisphaera ngatamarikiensis TaxID=1324935 RepID=A0A6M1S4F3_9BACT|nr:Gfo/Idh/MocA family oxidoreductase [Limisphaera ngatamarikiensis]NGO40170.1 Gfo/Idh/MocA family oxidoreductase [Limisphaera ngatamarikiensis]
MSTSPINVALIGCGAIALQNHLPGLALCKDVRLKAICDADPARLEAARQTTGAEIASTRFESIVSRDDIHAVIIATPNDTHAPIALAALAHGKHVLCEKPLALNARQAWEMVRAAEAAGVRHMTAFTYRFVPAMRYLASRIHAGDLGQPYHFRACRLQDWGSRPLGWRQSRARAGTGELGDMLSHRLDFGHWLMGPIHRLCAHWRRWHATRGGQPNELDEWVAVLADFRNGATGVWESSKLATGRGESWQSPDTVELNGSHATFLYDTRQWNRLWLGRPGQTDLEPLDVPREFWTWPGSPRDPARGNPLITFRHDQTWEFIQAIREERPCAVTFRDGARVQEVMDAIAQSAEHHQWIELPPWTETP